MRKRMTTRNLFIACFGFVFITCNTKPKQQPLDGNSKQTTSTSEVRPAEDNKNIKQVLFFEQRFGNAPNQKASYELIFEGDKVEMKYQYADNNPMLEKAEFKGGKIVKDGCSDCYMLQPDGLCITNQETAIPDCYSLIKSKSTCSVETLLNPNSYTANTNKSRLMRFHDVEQELSHQLQKQIVPFLGKPDVKGVINHCGMDFSYFFVYFNKVETNNGQASHLVILTYGNSGVGETALGEIHTIRAVEDGDKVYSGWSGICKGADEYIKVSSSGISSNSPEFKIR